VLSVGDAAGHVKPTTGGGLYLGAVAAAAAAEVLNDALERDDLGARTLSSYDARWRATFGAELRRGAVARTVYSRLSARQVDGIIDMAERTHVAETLLRSPSFSFDHHSGALLSGLLRCLPGALLRPAVGRAEADS
jgi:flavin-dependent dehydrogenase